MVRRSSWTRAALVAAAGALAGHPQALATGPCQPVAGGRVFDLAALQDTHKELLLRFDDAQDAALVYFSLCRPLSSLTSIVTTCGQQHKETTNVVSVNLNGCKGWGSLAGTTSWMPLEGDPASGLVGEFVFAPGDGQCAGKRSAVIALHCLAAGETEPAMVAGVSEADRCQLDVALWSTAGCPTDAPAPPADAGDAPKGGESGPEGEATGPAEASSFGSFLLVVILLFLVYCFVGVAQNMRSEGRQGIDAIPHREFWFALPAMVSQLGAIVVDKISALMGNNSRVGGSDSSYQGFDSTIGAGPGSGPAPGFQQSGGAAAASQPAVI